jgi:ComEC/Rec2-related protein
MLVLLALCGAAAARIGSELAARWPVAFASSVHVAPMLWWLAVALSVAGAVAAVLQHRSISRRLLVVVLVFAGHGAAQWHRLATPQVGNFSGPAIARSDAGNRNGAVSLIVSVDDEKFRLTVYGRERGALRRVRMGDTVILDATRVAYDERRLRFVAGRHVQGELREVTVYATAPAHALWHRAANRVHELIDRGARTMQWQDAALVRGFVLGDESRHPQRMTEAFRGAGLGHLLAVSGQNVALILAALTPGLRRLSRWPRLAVALGVVSMFAVVTRLESSVVRAAVMAAVVQIGFAIGRDVVPLRALAMTVLGIVGLDPLATWSVGFVLSVAATTGLVVITPHLGSSVFAATTAAQLGVLPFVLMWFGAMPVVALGTNVLAVPVASGVMMAAPVLLAVAAFVPDAVAGLLAMPVVAAVRWVWWVAEWGTRLSVRGPVNALAWGLVVVGVLIRKKRRHHLH